MQEPSYQGSCFCGAVRLTVSGAPVAMGYCHCQSCRAWSAAPVNAFMLWHTADVAVTAGASEVGTYHKTAKSLRQFCRKCGGHVMTAHPNWNLVDVYAAVVPAFPFRPQVHVNYAERVLPLRDGLPKLKDLPKDMGGTGDPAAED